MRFNPFGFFARLARREVQRIENRELSALAEQAMQSIGNRFDPIHMNIPIDPSRFQLVDPAGELSYNGPIQAGQRVTFSGFQNPALNGERIIRQNFRLRLNGLGSGNFNTWIRGLDERTELERFYGLIDKGKNALERLEFRRKIGILNWMDAVKDYKDFGGLPF